MKYIYNNIHNLYNLNFRLLSSKSKVKTEVDKYKYYETETVTDTLNPCNLLQLDFSDRLASQFVSDHGSDVQIKRR